MRGDSEPKFRVLLIEDDQEDVYLVKRALAELPAYGMSSSDLLVAPEGEQALAALNFAHANNQTPDLIFLDLHMPGLDGFGFLDAAKRDSRFREIPVVVLATDVANKDRKKLNELGAAAVHSKLNSTRDMASLFDEILPVWLV